METNSSAAPGIVGTLLTLAENLLGGVQDRVELFSLELREEKLRQVRIVAWTCALVFISMMACTFATLTLVFLFWETARLPVLAGITGAYAVAAAVLGVAFRRFLARQPRPFAGTLEEFHRDRTWLRRI
ncbi:MAG TPA: phage holin family protein [Opitutaceae bacterium]|nr:phage holin family protein [Opitutaceae bacterium]